MPAYEILLRVDYDALMRGYATQGETCEIAGFGPVGTDVVADVMEHGNPFLKAVLTNGKDVVGVVHFGRRPAAHQKTALDWLFPNCAVEGCAARGIWLETDHRVEWSKTRFTALWCLDRLCRRHHAMKTYRGWALVAGNGKRAFVLPEDPRHPSHFGGTGPPGGNETKTSGAAQSEPDGHGSALGSRARARTVQARLAGLRGTSLSRQVTVMRQRPPGVPDPKPKEYSSGSSRSPRGRPGRAPADLCFAKLRECADGERATMQVDP